MKITGKPAPAALAIVLTALVPAPGRAADHPGTSHTDQDASPPIETVETLSDNTEADLALVTDCRRWKAICYANRFGIYDAWMQDCNWTEILCTLECFAQCMTPWGLDVNCFWPRLGDCAVDTTECRSGALEFLEDFPDACYEARDCPSLDASTCSLIGSARRSSSRTLHLHSQNDRRLTHVRQPQWSVR